MLTYISFDFLRFLPGMGKGLDVLSGYPFQLRLLSVMSSRTYRTFDVLDREDQLTRRTFEVQLGVGSCRFGCAEYILMTVWTRSAIHQGKMTCLRAVTRVKGRAVLLDLDLHRGGIHELRTSENISCRYMEIVFQGISE
jgi:hypothetical protein